METKDQPLEAQLFSEVVLELNIARKNVSSYPKGHPLIKATVEKAFNLLKKFLSSKNEITIGVAKDTLLVGEDYLDQKNPVFRNFALALNRKAIASVTFLEPIEKDEFVRFHDLISSEQKTDKSFEEIVSAVNKVDMENIKIKVLDYRAFRIIEEKRLNAQQKADKLWDSFIRALLEGLLDIIDYEGGDDLTETLKISPASLAEELNQKDAKDVSQALCDKTITSFLSQIGDSAEERKINLGRLTEFISNLKPELREKILAPIIEHLSEHQDLANDILSEFPEELIRDVIEIISEKDMNVPSAVLTLLQKLADTGQGGAALEWARVEKETLGDLTEEEIKKVLPTVLKDGVTSSDYSKTLSNLIASAQTSEITKTVEETIKDIGIDNIEGKMTDVIFEILGGNIPNGEFSKLIRKLKEMSAFFLETGQFNILTKIYDTLSFYAKSDNEMHANVSKETIQFFSEKDFMEEAINGFNLWEKEKYEDISKLIRKIGTAFILLLLDMLSKEKDSLRKKILTELISTFGAAITSEVIASVKDSTPHFIRNLIIILRQSNNRDVIPIVLRFRKHPDPKVQIEALRTLLYFKAPDVSIMLGEAIASKNDEISYAALSLAGTYKVGTVIDLLLDILWRRIFWGTNLEKKEACVRALGKIGDPAALQGLSKVYKAKSFFKRRTLTKLKVSIIRSMEKYPIDEASAFLETLSASGRLKNNDLQKAYTELLDNIKNKKAI